jgi:hypothetical protein
MSRSKNNGRRYVGEKLYYAEVARRKALRACDDVAKVIAAYEEVAIRAEAA